ncbi:MAG: ABC transporter substrate-binding protein [Halobacterium sp.]
MTPTPHSRRAFLASTAAASAALAGCNGLQYRDRYSPGERVSLTVSAPPADDDGAATRLARTLTDRLSAVGVDATFQPKGQSQLYLDALINNDFDVFVARHPGFAHPDTLYSLLHSSFASEPGWQNPFGVTSVALDESLEAMRAAGDPVSELPQFLDAYVARVPFSVVAAPDFLTVRRDGLSVREDAVTEQPLDVLELLADAGGDRPLRAAIFSVEATENRNPIAGEFRWNRQLLGLLYDPLARPGRDGSLLPWAAREWAFEGDELVVKLRPGQTFHDGTDLTAADVAFTARFLSDTSMGGASSRVPATRYRGRTSLVTGATATDDETVHFDVASGVSPATAERVLTLPILPAAEWRERTGLVDDRVTQALVWENRQPVGSGPLRFDGATPEESVSLRPFDDHFLADVDDGPASRYAPALDGGGLTALYAPSGQAALAALSEGRLDTSLHLFPLYAFDDAQRTDGVVPASASSDALCIVGYNVRRPPLSEYPFRRVLARLHDRDHAVASVFKGFAAPAELPVAGHWDGVDGLTDDYTVGAFPGSDGELDVERARQLFEDAGYTYDEDGNLFR